MTTDVHPVSLAGPPDTAATDAFVERLFGSVLGALDLQAVYLGDRLGYYRALADRPAHLDRAGRAHRYRRAVRPRVAGAAGRHRDPRDRRSGRRRRSPVATRCRPPHVGPLTDALDPSHFAPFVRFVVGSAQADRADGGGVPHRRRGDLGRARRRTPARARPPRTARCSSVRWAGSTCRRSRTSTPRCAPAAGWPTSAAGWAGRRSASRWPTRTPRSTATTSTRRRSRRRAATPARPGSTTGCGSTPADAATVDSGGATTSCSPSSASTTCPTRSAVLAAMRRLAGDGGTVRGHGRAGGRDVHRPRRRRRAADVRLQPGVLPGRRDGARAVGGHRHGDAARRRCAATPSRRGSPTSRSSTSRTTSSASTACADGGRPRREAAGGLQHGGYAAAECSKATMLSSPTARTSSTRFTGDTRGIRPRARRAQDSRRPRRPR